MTYFNELAPSHISFYVDYQQIKKVAWDLIGQVIGKKIPVELECKKLEGDILFRLELDISSLDEAENSKLQAYGFSEETPYVNFDIVYQTLFEGLPKPAITRVSESGSEDDYFEVEIYYLDYVEAIERNKIAPAF
ncbi:hypothetical protein LCM20_12180 [Halobacillus litoralis]|uniref:hypothetical protein n=1 Tax=Halobacillus litoralis TaxID=45668 RepID=UPI001CD37656|nr:hypothetical protein [Halobacillus litoralis]MCA0971354.1 hypothetical protein [Halobacillus litoralis]